MEEYWFDKPSLALENVRKKNEILFFPYQALCGLWCDMWRQQSNEASTKIYCWCFLFFVLFNVIVVVTMRKKILTIPQELFLVCFPATCIMSWMWVAISLRQTSNVPIGRIIIVFHCYPLNQCEHLFNRNTCVLCVCLWCNQKSYGVLMSKLCQKHNSIVIADDVFLFCGSVFILWQCWEHAKCVVETTNNDCICNNNRHLQNECLMIRRNFWFPHAWKSTALKGIKIWCLFNL